MDDSDYIDAWSVMNEFKDALENALYVAKQTNQEEYIIKTLEALVNYYYSKSRQTK